MPAHETTPWSPQHCPFRIAVTSLRVTDTSGRVHELDIDDRDGRGQRLLTELRMAALMKPQVLSTYDGLLDSKKLRHPGDCPLCALHHRPGPRVWGCWITESWRGHPRYSDDHTEDRGPRHRGIELFGDLGHARDTMTELSRVIADARQEPVRSTWEVGDFHAWTDTVPDYRSRIVTRTSQLWVWRRPPTDWWPDLALTFTPDWTLNEITGADLRQQHAAGAIPSGVLAGPAPAGPPDTLQLGTFTVRCTGTSRDLQVISIRDADSSAPARRILLDGRPLPLPDTVPGLTVYGRWQHERPALARLPELTPEYASLLPQIQQQFTR
ncbi:hypothetical protein [Nocardia wallacei]|uniref:hypothetical protein n=1 Tax=Nocardia wallacei TaxID=480035 RepID=UPI0024549591|nr:hypothetical protein [Nocardia wallacei]